MTLRLHAVALIVVFGLVLPSPSAQADTQRDAQTSARFMAACTAIGTTEEIAQLRKHCTCLLSRLVISSVSYEDMDWLIDNYGISALRTMVQRYPAFRMSYENCFI